MTTSKPLRNFILLAMTSAALTVAACGQAEHADEPLSSEGSTIPTIGADEPLVAVTVFCDYQCPACRAAHRTLSSLASHFGDTVQLRYRQFPLIGSHHLARDAAVYALAAHRQGHFSCMNTLLYQQQPEWEELTPEAFREAAIGYAAACHVDAERYAIDIADPSLGQQVDDDAEIARTLEPRGGTPTIYVSGLQPSRPRAGTPHSRLLIPRIRSELRQARALIEGGLPRSEVARQKIFGDTGDAERTRMIYGD